MIQIQMRTISLRHWEIKSLENREWIVWAGENIGEILEHYRMYSTVLGDYLPVMLTFQFHRNRFLTLCMVHMKKPCMLPSTRDTDWCSRTKTVLNSTRCGMPNTFSRRQITSWTSREIYEIKISWELLTLIKSFPNVAPEILVRLRFRTLKSGKTGNFPFTILYRSLLVAGRINR